MQNLNINANKVLLVACGGAAVINLPGWVHALRMLAPKIELEVVLSNSAKQLVSSNALIAVLGRKPYFDGNLFNDNGVVLHRYLAEWPDAVIVAPLTLNTLSKSALFIADSLVTSILNMSDAPILRGPFVSGKAEQ